MRAFVGAVVGGGGGRDGGGSGVDLFWWTGYNSHHRY